MKLNDLPEINSVGEDCPEVLKRAAAASASDGRAAFAAGGSARRSGAPVSGCAAPCEEGGRRFLLRQRGGRGRHAACAAQHRGAARAAPAPERGCGRGARCVLVLAGAGVAAASLLSGREEIPVPAVVPVTEAGGGNRQGDGEGGRPAGSGAGSPARRRVDQRGGCRRFERGLCRCVLQGHVWREVVYVEKSLVRTSNEAGARAMGGVCCGRRDHLREVRLVGRGHPDAFPQRGSHRARRVRRSPVSSATRTASRATFLPTRSCGKRWKNRKRKRAMRLRRRGSSGMPAGLRGSGSGSTGGGSGSGGAGSGSGGSADGGGSGFRFRRRFEFGLGRVCRRRVVLGRFGFRFGRLWVFWQRHPLHSGGRGRSPASHQLHGRIRPVPGWAWAFAYADEPADAVVADAAATHAVGAADAAGSADAAGAVPESET